MDQARRQCAHRDLSLSHQSMSDIEQEHMEGLALRAANPRLEMPVDIHGVSDQLPALERLRFDPTCKLEGRQKTRRLRRPETLQCLKRRHRAARQLSQSSSVLDDGPRERVGSARLRACPKDERKQLRIRESVRSKTREALTGSIMRRDRTRA